jgi:integrase
MQHAKRNKSKSSVETIRRLRSFFPDLDSPVADLTEAQCSSYYQAYTQRRKRNGESIAVDTHRNVLGHAKTFLGWCVLQRKWLSANPLENVKGIGRRRKGKAQLRIDEVRKWEPKALELAAAGDEGAVAALMELYMGLRATEITLRTVRDVDDEARVLWVAADHPEEGKTEAARRRVEIPEMLQPFLRKLIEGRQAHEYLFAGKDGRPHLRDWPRNRTHRICDLAGVPRVCAHSMRGSRRRSQPMRA